MLGSWREVRRRAVVMGQVALAAAVMMACGGGEVAHEEPADAAPAGGAPAGQAGGPAAGADTVALGGQIFRGEQAGGTCYTCHGQNGEGTAIGPNLTDDEWLNIPSKSVENIVNVVKSGVAQPRQYPAPMPPMGGAQLTDQQVRAVAEYVASL